MAVQAQYPANVHPLLHKRGETERKNMEMDADFVPSLHEQNPVFFSPNEGNVNPRKRGREVAMAAPLAVVSPQVQQTSVFSMQTPPSALTPALLGLAQFQPSTPSLGLRLAFKDQNQNQNQREQTDSILSPISKDLATEINQQKREIEQLLITQGEQLRREMAEKRQRHYRILLASVDKLFGNKLREKEAQVELAARRTAELQDRFTRLRTESMAWQAKAIAEQTAAASLHAQLQQAAAAAAAASALAGEECCGESLAEDAGSAYVDPDRPDERSRPCWTCQTRPASVVLLPCRHLCICPACDSAGAVTDGCPACGAFRTGSLQVFFS